MSHIITSLDDLLAIYAEPREASVRKEVDRVTPHYAAMIAASPFFVLATSGPGGLDASPRGDAPGFVVVEDERTLLVPDRPGNNRIDSLRNLVHDPRVALLFLIPGVGETLRVVGRATISADPALLDRFLVQDRRPRCVLVVHVETVYFQCARAIHRSHLWDPPAPDVRTKVPSVGTILDALTDGKIDGAKYDAELPKRQRETLY